MLIFALECSVCGGIFHSKREWLEHLVTEGHQTLARTELLNWTEAERALVLVIFGKLPVGENDKIIQHLSNDADGVVVSDFVWWRERQRVGFVQFRTRDQVEVVLGSMLLEQQFQIEEEGQVCKVVAADTISELEWSGLLPQKSVTTTPQQHVPKSMPAPRPTIIASASSSSSPPPPPRSLGLKSEGAGAVGIGTATCTNNDLGLKNHLNLIRKSIEIPDQDYALAKDLIQRLKTISKRVGKSECYLFRACLSRQWILKLKSSPVTDELSIVLYRYKGSDDVLDGTITLSKLKEMDKQMFRHGSPFNFISRFKVFSAAAVPVPPLIKGGGYMRYKLRNPNTDRPFNVLLNTNPFFLLEAEVWKLVKYGCSFDPRCYPVLLVAHYWARENNIRVGSFEGRSNDLPDPSGLNWLLMTFFYREGLIPSVNWIMKQPHQTLTYEGTDIGFSSKASTVEFWRAGKYIEQAVEEDDDDEGEQFAYEIFTLLYKFFLFCGSSLAEGNGWILNTRFGEVLPLDELMMTGGSLKNTMLTLEEQADIKKAIVANGNDRDRIVMLHPLMLNWRISTSNAEMAFRLMNESGRRLKEYLDPPEPWNIRGNRRKFNFQEFVMDSLIL